MPQSGVSSIVGMLLAAMTVAAGPPASADHPHRRFVTIGTGAPSGVYHLVGEEICAAVNRRAARLAASGAALVTLCRAGPSGGSAFNIRQVRSGAFTFALAQANVQQIAYGGGLPGTVVPVPGLRTVFSLHEEALQIVVPSTSAAGAVADLAGMRFSPGNPGSGSRQLALRVIEALGLDGSGFADIELMTVETQVERLCTGAIDAFAVVAAVPHPPVEAAVETCGARLIPVDGPEERELVRRAPLLSTVEIPADAYDTLDAPLRTIGVRAGLVTRLDVPEDVVRDVVEAVLDDLPRLRAVHPALAGLDPVEMASEGLGAPLHSGAAAVFAERGAK